MRKPVFGVLVVTAKLICIFVFAYANSRFSHVVAHFICVLRFCLLQVAKDYILGMSNEPLVLHGSSGSGKTSVMAMIAKEAWSWMKSKPAIILRFIGTTPGSCSINSLLSSITQQVRKAYNMNWAVSEVCDLLGLFTQEMSDLDNQ